eukprot:m.277209 g.277209  ORF g.277209 m.277209 type:complete len:108 (-) comp16305_c0_seq34:34-357(-)
MSDRVRRFGRSIARTVVSPLKRVQGLRTDSPPSDEVENEPQSRNISARYPSKCSPELKFAWEKFAKAFLNEGGPDATTDLFESVLLYQVFFDLFICFIITYIFKLKL